MPVVKSNAYGHGFELVVGELAKAGTTWFGVNSLQEGAALRALSPQAHILVLGYTDPSGFPAAVGANLDLTLTNPEELPALDRVAGSASARARVHLKVESGTHRRGLTPDEFPSLQNATERYPNLEWVGVSTHFANIEDTLNHEYAQGQLGRFGEAVGDLERLGLHFQHRHVACTAATLLFPETHMDMARVGIGLYGLWPSRETLISLRTASQTPPALRPCLSWRTRVTQIKDVGAGEYVGYGCTYRTSVRSRIGVLPIGYYEGYDRRLSNAAHVLVRGQRAPVRGRVCMNMTLIDLTHVAGAVVGDRATLIGTSGEESIAAEELAGWAGTINYEIVTRIHPSLPRIGEHGGG